MPRKKNKTENDKLTSLEERFVSIYIHNCGNATQAYLLASPNNVTYDTARAEGSACLARPNVAKAIELKKLEIRNKEQIELSFLVSSLKEVIYDVKTEETERDNTGRIVAKPDRASLIKAVDTLAKLGGFYTQKMDVTSNGQTIIPEIKINIVQPKQDEE